MLLSCDWATLAVASLYAKLSKMQLRNYVHRNESGINLQTFRRSAGQLIALFPQIPQLIAKSRTVNVSFCPVTSCVCVCRKKQSVRLCPRLLRRPRRSRTSWWTVLTPINPVSLSHIIITMTSSSKSYQHVPHARSVGSACRQRRAAKPFIPPHTFWCVLDFRL